MFVKNPFATMRLVIALVIILYSLKGFSQKDDPKVAVVLSGGGAKGLAHIGVLQVLDSIGLYPDIVTGTSMGSVIGGLYAIGYSGKEIETLAGDIDWESILSNRIPLREVAFEEKNYYGRYFAELPVIKNVPQLPKGVIEGQQLHEKLAALTLPAHGINDFDELPIPYRAIATDIETGEVVVLKSGSLPTAIRASMAIPSVFTPVELDGRLLVDGGLVRNLPVQEALDMGADIVISVFVSSDLSTKEELNTLVDILLQSSWVLSAYDSREQKKKSDYYIEPELQQFETLGFDQADSIVISGKAAGLAMAESFQTLYDSLKASGKRFRKPQRNPDIKNIAISEVSVEGNERISQALIEEKLGIASYAELEVEQLTRRIERLFGTQHFSKINYEILGDSAQSKLVIHVDESEANTLKTAFHFNNESGLGINVNFTSRNKFWKASRLVAEIDVAENPRLDLSLLKYTGVKQDYAFTLGYSVLNYEVPLIQNVQQLATFEYIKNQFFLQFQSTKEAIRSYGLRLEAYANSFEPKVSGDLSNLERGNENSFNIGFFWQYNDLNKPFFTTHGTKASLSAGRVFENHTKVTFHSDTSDNTISTALAADDFTYVHAGWEQFFPLKQNLTLEASAEMRYTSTDNVGPNYMIGHGGFFFNYETVRPFWGAKFYEFQTTGFLRANAGLQWNFLSGFYLTAKVNYLTVDYPTKWVDDDRQPAALRGSHHLLGAGLQLGYESLLGPMLISVGKGGESNNWFAGLNIGFWF